MLKDKLKQKACENVNEKCFCFYSWKKLLEMIIRNENIKGAILCFLEIFDDLEAYGVK